MNRRSHPPLNRARRWARYFAIAAGVVVVLFAAVYVVTRVYLLPMLVARKGEIEAWLAANVQHPVHLGRIETYWRGMNPGVRVYGVTVYDRDGRNPTIRIGRVEVSVSPLSLLQGQVNVYRLVLIRPSLTLARNGDGDIGIADMDLPSGTPAGAGVGLLLTQPRLEVRDGELRWQDARDPHGPFTFSDIDLELRNSGVRHRLEASADFPDAICHRCALTADITSDPRKGSWDGDIALRTDGFDVQALPLVVRERLPADVRGRFDANLWSEWRDGRPRVVRGKAAATQLRFPFGAKPQFIALRQLAAEVFWQATDDGWRLQLRRLNLGLVNKPWFAGRLRLEHGTAGNLFEIDHLDLDDVTRFVAKNQTQHPMLRHWAEFDPSGALDALRIKTQGPLASPSNFQLSAQLVRLGTKPYERFPSVSGLSGHVSLDRNAGKIDIDSNDVSFFMPRVFRAPFGAAQASGSVTWRRTETAWHITGATLKAEGEDGKGSGTLTLDVPYDRAESPVLKLRVDFRDGNGAHAARYYPVHKLPPRALKWMESSFIDGRVTSGHLLYDGPIREFPFEAGQGKFELHAQVRDGVYRYLPGWKPLTQARATVDIDGADAVITGSGRIGTLRAHDVRVEVQREPEAAARVVRVRGKVDGPVAETVGVLQGAKTDKDHAWRGAVKEIASASGTGALELDVRVLLTPEVEPSFFATYRVKDAALKLNNGSGIDRADGVVRFTEAGLHDSDLQGQLFGGPTSFVSAYTADGLRVSASGRFMLPELLRSRSEIADRVSGGIDWSFEWNDNPNGARLRADADFSEVRTQLPPPLTRKRGDRSDQVTVTTEVSSPKALVLSVNAGAAASGKLAFARRHDHWHFDRGRIDFGGSTASLPRRNGLEIGLNVDALDVDEWLPLLERTGHGLTFGNVTGVTADIKQLGLLNRHWGRSFLHFVRYGDEWKLVVDGDAAAGEGTLVPRTADRARLRFDLAYLRLPPRRDRESVDDRPADPRRLPAVELRARKFEYKQHDFGELRFMAAPDSQGWRIDRLSLTRPELTLAVDGVWHRRRGRQSSEFNIDWNSDDMGTSLDALGMPDQMKKGKTRVKAHLAWPGAPTEPKLAGMSGNIEITAENGRFLKLDPGAARLFGLLDLRSIGRYLLLDFSPAFGKGFAFDAIHGTIAIDNGNARTNDLLVKGPVLSLGVVGRVGLATEDYDLAIEASPHIGSTLTLTSWGLFGPQVAAAVLALQRLFKHQIQEGTRTTYLVKGPWDNPNVTKLSKPAPALPPLNDPTQ
jgi:uncharacterized protein (TIGR02099 family)